MLRKALPFFTVAAVMACAAAPASAQKETLRMAYWAGPAHHMVKTQEAWIKTIEQASGGNLTVEVDKAALAKPDGQYDLIKNGVRDLVLARSRLYEGPLRHAGRGRDPVPVPKRNRVQPGAVEVVSKERSGR